MPNTSGVPPLCAYPLVPHPLSPAAQILQTATSSSLTSAANVQHAAAPTAPSRPSQVQALVRKAQLGGTAGTGTEWTRGAKEANGGRCSETTVRMTWRMRLVARGPELVATSGWCGAVRANRYPPRNIGRHTNLVYAVRAMRPRQVRSPQRLATISGLKRRRPRGASKADGSPTRDLPAPRLFRGPPAQPQECGRGVAVESRGPPGAVGRRCSRGRPLSSRSGSGPAPLGRRHWSAWALL